jgi:two-component system, NarL family, sensor histidine kinase UhpB
VIHSPATAFPRDSGALGVRPLSWLQSIVVPLQPGWFKVAARRSTSHRYSLTVTLSVSLALAVTLALAVSILLALIEAQDRVRAECDSAMNLARRMLHLADQTPPRVFGHQRVMTTVMAMGEFRHLRIDVTGVGGDLPVGVAETLRHRPESSGSPPIWFADLMAGAAGAITPLVIRSHPVLGDITVSPEPLDETLEVWLELQTLLARDLILVLAVSALIYALVRYSLRPLRALEAAFERVGQGDFKARAPDTGPRELQPICTGFDRTVADLQRSHQDRQALSRQLVTLQEDERRAIARELHDELSSFLFCIRIDANSHVDTIDDSSMEDMRESFVAINDNVARIQERVQVLLHSLRPIDIDVHGWPEAIKALLEGWRLRGSQVQFHLELSAHLSELEDVMRVSCYRIVQECVTNSIRHGAPKHVWVRLAFEGYQQGAQSLHVEVSDDGLGLSNEHAHGRGLSGMRDRVQALGGRFELHQREGGGLKVAAYFPS